METYICTCTHIQYSKSTYHIDTGTFLASLLTIARKEWNQSRCSPTKMYRDTAAFNSARKINEIMIFARKLMQLEIIIPSQASQTKKDNHYYVYIWCVCMCVSMYVRWNGTLRVLGGYIREGEESRNGDYLVWEGNQP